MTPEIMNFVARYRRDFPFAPGRVLEVGSYNVNGTVREFFSDAAEYIGIDQSAGPCVDLVLPASEALSRFGEQSYDTVLCFEMLEHDPTPLLTVSAMRSLLRSGGHLLISSPANAFPLHRYPRDYWRFMDDAYTDIFFAGMQIMRFEAVGGQYKINCCGGVK